MCEADLPNALMDYIDPATGFLHLEGGVHWSEVLARPAMIPLPDEAVYQLLREHLCRLVAENRRLPTEQELVTRLGPCWRDQAERLGIKKYWPTKVHYDERAQLGIAQTLNPWGWVGTCAQVAGAQAQETYRREKHLGSSESRRPSEAELTRLCEKESIGFTEQKATQWIEEGILVVIDDQAGDLLDQCWETISRSALNQRIEEKARALDPGEVCFQRVEMQSIGVWSGLPITRDLTHQKKDPIFSRILVAVERAQAIVSRCGRPELLAYVRSQGAMLTESDILQAQRDQLADEDVLPETGELYRLKYLLGFAYPEDMQRFSLLHPDGVELAWRANLVIESASETALWGFARDASSGLCFIDKYTVISLQHLKGLVDKSGMVVTTIHFPWDEDAVQLAGHSIAVHRVEEDQAQCFANDSGPRGAIDRVGGFLTKEGIIPIAGFAGAKDVRFTYTQMEHWLYGYQEIRIGNLPAKLCANTLIPTAK